MQREGLLVGPSTLAFPSVFFQFFFVTRQAMPPQKQRSQKFSNFRQTSIRAGKTLQKRDSLSCASKTNMNPIRLFVSGLYLFTSARSLLRSERGTLEEKNPLTASAHRASKNERIYFGMPEESRRALNISHRFTATKSIPWYSR